MKYTNMQTNNTKLLFKNYVKLTLQCRSNCSDDKENFKIARELKSVSCGDSWFHIDRTW